PRGRSLRLQPAADEALAAPAAVSVGGVEDVDAGLERAIHQRPRLPLVVAHPEELRRRSDAAEVAAAERDPRDLQTRRPETPVLHRAPAYRISSVFGRWSSVVGRRSSVLGPDVRWPPPWPPRRRFLPRRRTRCGACSGSASALP